MSKMYPIWWDSTVTVYNKYEDLTTNAITWYATVVPGCFWKYVGDDLSRDLTQEDAYDTVCRVPEHPLFRPNYIWNALSAAEKADYFTLNLNDIIIKGEVDDTINEYVQGHRSTEILEKYKKLQGCILIKEFAIDTGPGRCCPHYRVYGI